MSTVGKVIIGVAAAAVVLCGVCVTIAVLTDDTDIPIGRNDRDALEY